MKRCLALLAFLLPLHQARAIDPGIAQGSLQIDGAAVPLKHAFAHLHDNAEKLLEHPRELRVLLTDREIPQSALAGIAFAQVVRMARAGELRGLLLRLDADQPVRALVTVLGTAQAAGPAAQAVKKLELAHNRVSGQIYGVRFSAPLFSEPRVTADLRGREALDSPQGRAVREKSPRQPLRVVVRGERAVAIFAGNEWTSLVRVGGEWQAD